MLALLPTCPAAIRLVFGVSELSSFPSSFSSSRSLASCVRDHDHYRHPDLRFHHHDHDHLVSFVPTGARQQQHTYWLFLPSLSSPPCCSSCFCFVPVIMVINNEINTRRSSSSRYLCSHLRYCHIASLSVRRHASNNTERVAMKGEYSSTSEGLV